MTDYDGEQYTALFEQFQVNSFSFLFARFCQLLLQTRTNFINGSDIFKQVGQGDGYVLTVEGFNDARSTLGNYMGVHNGMKFSTR